MILTLPFCIKDGDLAVKNLLWMEELDGKLPFDVVLSHDTETPATIVRDMKEIANRVFSRVETFWYPPSLKKYWPAAPNWAWQNVARYIEALVKKPWLFLEADAVPIRSKWLHDIKADYFEAGKAFAGHVVDGMGHINGSCVYPHDVSRYSVSAFRTEETAWDVVLGHDLALMPGGIWTVVHPAHTLFQHCWAINPADGRPWNGAGDLATFKSMHDVIRLCDTTMALFHRCKDGSLIHWLREFHKDPSRVMVPQHTENEKQPSSSIEDVPRMEPVVSVPVTGPKDRIESSKPRFTGSCEIFIVTYGLPTKRNSNIVVSDFDWLRWCLRCIRRHCTGFSGVTIVFPARDANLFADIAREHAQAKSGIPLKVKMVKENATKGMIEHMICMASADAFVPEGTTHVLHVDADVMFKEAVTPDEYFHGDKPVYVVRSYESLIEQRDGQRVVSDCHQWKGPTEAQLGFPATVYTMLRHPSGFPLRFYNMYRQHIESIHGKPFKDYMLEGESKFPQTRMDFTAMGSFAYERMRDSFDWLDISGGNHLAPKDKQKCYWSHGGISPHIEAEITGYLK